MHDVFISHASEDKADIVLPLTRALNDAAISYWLDASEIGWGDSIFRKINDGLSSSKYALVLISDAFMQKHWTEAELEAAFASEMRSGTKFILPVLCSSADRVLNRFPLLAARRYLTLPTPISSLAIEVAHVLGREYKQHWSHNHNREYSGVVHITVLKHPKHLCEPYNLVVEWGHMRRKIKVSSSQIHAVSLVHTKGDDGMSVPLFLKSDKPLYARFGIGSGLSAQIDINSWWLPTKWS
jgi:hypothetical protein